jgi:hypothetical protein
MADAALDSLRAATRECAATARLFSAEQCAEAAAHASVLQAFFFIAPAAAAISALRVVERAGPLLPQLPTELIVEVLQHMDTRSLGRPACTCRQLHFGPPCPPRPMSLVEAAIRRRADAIGRWTPSSLPAGVSKWVPFLLQREWWDEMQRCTVAAGRDRSFFVDENGTLLACGQAEALGLLGLQGNTGQSSFKAVVPTPVPSLAGVRIRAVLCHNDRNLAVSEAGQVFAWGYSALRRGETGWREWHAPGPTPVLALENHRVCQVVGGCYHCAALTDDGSLFTWASRSNGEPHEPSAALGYGSFARPLRGHIASLRSRTCASSRWRSAVASLWL